MTQTPKLQRCSQNEPVVHLGDHRSTEAQLQDCQTQRVHLNTWVTLDADQQV